MKRFFSHGAITFEVLQDGRVVALGSKVYEVDLNEPHCDCFDFQHRKKAEGKFCKHLEALREVALEMGAGDGGTGMKFSQETSPGPGLFAEEPVVNSPPALSPSSAHLLISQSPLHCWYRKFGGAPEEYAEATDMGKLAHALLLSGPEVVPVEADNWRTAAAREQRDHARLGGKIPALSAVVKQVSELVDYVHGFLAARDLPLCGEREKPVEWMEQCVDKFVPCHGRLDHWSRETATVMDFKFGASAHPDILARQFITLGYDVKAAAYRSAVEHLYPELAGRIRTIFCFVEIEPPHAITLARPGGVMRALGESKWLRAVELWRRCLAEFGPEKPWPAYSDSIEQLVAPNWAMEKEVAFGERIGIG